MMSVSDLHPIINHYARGHSLNVARGDLAIPARAAWPNHHARGPSLSFLRSAPSALRTPGPSMDLGFACEAHSCEETRQSTGAPRSRPFPRILGLLPARRESGELASHLRSDYSQARLEPAEATSGSASGSRR